MGGAGEIRGPLNAVEWAVVGTGENMPVKHHGKERRR